MAAGRGEDSKEEISSEKLEKMRRDNETIRKIKEDEAEVARALEITQTLRGVEDPSQSAINSRTSKLIAAAEARAVDRAIAAVIQADLDTEGKPEEKPIASSAIGLSESGLAVELQGYTVKSRALVDDVKPSSSHIVLTLDFSYFDMGYQEYRIGTETHKYQLPDSLIYYYLLSKTCYQYNVYWWLIRFVVNGNQIINNSEDITKVPSRFGYGDERFPRLSVEFCSKEYELHHYLYYLKPFVNQRATKLQFQNSLICGEVSYPFLQKVLEFNESLVIKTMQAAQITKFLPTPLAIMVQSYLSDDGISNSNHALPGSFARLLDLAQQVPYLRKLKLRWETKRNASMDTVYRKIRDEKDKDTYLGWKLERDVNLAVNYKALDDIPFWEVLFMVENFLVADQIGVKLMMLIDNMYNVKEIDHYSFSVIPIISDIYSQIIFNPFKPVNYDNLCRFETAIRQEPDREEKYMTELREKKINLDARRNEEASLAVELKNAESSWKFWRKTSDIKAKKEEIAVNNFKKNTISREIDALENHCIPHCRKIKNMEEEFLLSPLTAIVKIARDYVAEDSLREDMRKAFLFINASSASAAKLLTKSAKLTLHKGSTVFPDSSSCSSKINRINRVKAILGSSQ